MFGLERLSALLSKLHRDADAVVPDTFCQALYEIGGTLTASREALAALHRPACD